jgi:hypothetical protein
MYHRRFAIFFLIIILLIMPYYKSLKECMENSQIVDKNKHSELLTDYILLLRDSNQALMNDKHDDYTSQFNNLFQFYNEKKVE